MDDSTLILLLAAAAAGYYFGLQHGRARTVKPAVLG